jgi:hypothetical protein
MIPMLAPWHLNHALILCIIFIANATQLSLAILRTVHGEPSFYQIHIQVTHPIEVFEKLSMPPQEHSEKRYTPRIIIDKPQTVTPDSILAGSDVETRFLYSDKNSKTYQSQIIMLITT